LLALLEQALNVSEYTDNVDTVSRRSKTQRVIEGLREMLSISSGFYVCGDLKRGEKLVGRGLESPQSEAFLQGALEVGRRYKVMNPAKMRSSYGKLMYMLQDAMPRSTQEALGLKLWRPLEMVPSFLDSKLDSKGALDLLRDPRLRVATMHVSAHCEGGLSRPRAEIDQDLARKRAAEEALVESWAKQKGGKLSADEVRRVVASIADAGSYVALNVRPVEQILCLLTENFTPASAEKGHSLALGGGGLTGMLSSAVGTGFYGRGYGLGYGLGGASSRWGARPKLSHDHQTQFTFCFQTFNLWREVAFKNTHAKKYIINRKQTQTQYPPLPSARFSRLTIFKF